MCILFNDHVTEVHRHDEPKPPLPRSTQPDPVTILRSAKIIYVKSSSVLVGEAVIETKLRNRSEFQQLGLIITRDPLAADLILELKHDVLTKYVYTASILTQVSSLQAVNSVH